jgi:hypothetical protein
VSRATADDYLDALHGRRRLHLRDLLHKLVAAVTMLGAHRSF